MSFWMLPYDERAAELREDEEIHDGEASQDARQGGDDA